MVQLPLGVDIDHFENHCSRDFVLFGFIIFIALFWSLMRISLVQRNQLSLRLYFRNQFSAEKSVKSGWIGGLDRIQSFLIRIGLGLKNVTVCPSLVYSKDEHWTGLGLDWIRTIANLA